MFTPRPLIDKLQKEDYYTIDPLLKKVDFDPSASLEKKRQEAEIPGIFGSVLPD